MLIGFELDIPSLTQQGIQMGENAFDNVVELTSSSMFDWTTNDWDADSLEYIITLHSYVTPSNHLLSLHPSVFWISRIDQMQGISSSVEHIMIQGCVGRDERQTSFSLSNLPYLISITLGDCAFDKCHVIVFDSMNDWMIDEWDLKGLQSISLGSYAFGGNGCSIESNELIMKSMIDIDLIDEIFLLSLHS